MASAAAAEAVLFLLLHLAFGLRLSPSPSPSPSVHSPRRRARSAAAVALLAFAVAALLTATHVASAAESRPADALRAEVDELRLRVLHLESLLEENTKTLKSKANNLEENSNLIGTMEHDIEILMNKHESAKKSQSKSYPESNVKALEDEVQLLWKVVRKMNENADSIESLANGAEKRVESLSSEVKKMEGIIAEQWIQIRQLEQAFVLTKMMTSKVHQRSRLSETAYKWPGKDLVLKYVRNLHGTLIMGISYTKSCFSHTYKHCRSFIQAMNRPYHEVSRFCKAIICGQHIHDVDKPNVFFLGGSISRSCFSLPYKQLKIFMLSAQKFHHEVQIILQDAMRSNSYSRGFATELVTFCLAYFVVISPMWIVWFLYSTRFGSKK